MNENQYPLDVALEELLRICNEYDLPQYVKDLYFADSAKSTDTVILADGHILETVLKAIADYVENGVQL